jgi:paraquat-inducible protein B
MSSKGYYRIYFNESVNGLNVGALVKMQGVPIGKVTDIQVQLDPETKQILTPVFIEIDHAKCQQLLQIKEVNSKQMLMEQLVKNGLRMQLQYTSLVTGQLYVVNTVIPKIAISTAPRTKTPIIVGLACLLIHSSA